MSEVANSGLDDEEVQAREERRPLMRSTKRDGEERTKRKKGDVGRREE